MSQFLSISRAAAIALLNEANEVHQDIKADDDFHRFILYDGGIISAFFIALGLMITINKCQFSHVALVSIPTHTFSLKFKMWAMTVMIGLYVFSAFLAFFDDGYWTAKYSRLYGLIYLIPILVLFLNMKWHKFQFERRIPLVWYQNQFFWGLLSGGYLLSLISCYLIDGNRFQASDFIIMTTKFILSVVLLTHTVRTPQDIEYYLSDSSLGIPFLSNQSNRAHLSKNQGAGYKGRHRKDSVAKRRRLTASRQLNPEESSELPLSVTVVNKIQRVENPKTKELDVFYRLNIKACSREYKILRTLEDFKKLEASVQEEIQNNPNTSFAAESLHAALSDHEAQNMSNVSFIVLTLQNFINTVLKTENAPKTVLVFLEVQEPDRTKLMNWSKYKLDDKSLAIEINGKDGLDVSTNRKRQNSAENFDDDDDEEDETRPEESDEALSQESVARSRGSERDYCPYFNVNIPKYKRIVNGDYIEYQIYLQLVEKPDEAWQIKKRYSDFVDLREQLRNAMGFMPPKLPKKLLLVTEEDQLEERRKGLESWLRIVLSEKIFFTPQLFRFINLNPSYNEWLKDEEAYDFSNFRAIIDNNTIKMTNNKPYTVYHIIIEERGEFDNKKKKHNYTLLRRYKEFDQLNQALQIRFANSLVRLPELPPKYTTFSNKTTVDFRQQGLEKFLNSLFNYPNIGDSFAFRKFISFKRTTNESIISAKDSSERNSSYDDISNVRIEKSLSTARSKRDFQKNFLEPEL